MSKKNLKVILIVALLCTVALVYAFMGKDNSKNEVIGGADGPTSIQIKDNNDK